MIRKTIIAMAATAAIAALPSAASAKGGSRGFRVGIVGATLVGASMVAASCYRYQWVETRYGLRRVLVNVCY